MGFQKGNKLGCLNKGQVAWNKGKREGSILFYCKICSKEFYRSKSQVKYRKGCGNFCSKKCKGKWMSKVQKGFNSHLWKGGVSSKNRLIRYSQKMNIWRIKVFKRDNYTCQECGKKEYVEAHHIKSFANYPKLRFTVKNGITLCEECHDKITYKKYIK